MTDEYFDDIPDDVLDDGALPGNELASPEDIIAEVRSEDNFEPADEKQDTLLTYATQNVDIWVKAYHLQ